MTNIRTRRPSWAWLVVALTLLAVPFTAHAAPLVVTMPTGETIALSDGDGGHTFLPGDRINIAGESFARTTGGAGNPLLGVKLNDQDIPAGWTAGGADAYTGDAPGVDDEEFLTFEVRPDDTFSGWIQTPADAEPGDYWFRILGGSLSTGGPAGNRLQPISIAAPFAIVEQLQIGYRQTADSPLLPGNVVPAGGSTLWAVGADFTPGATLGATIDGDATTITDPVGGTPAVGTDGRIEAVIAVPSALAEGTHALVVTDGTVSVSRQLRVVAHSATLLTPAVRPGGMVAVRAQGFVGVGGAGQGLALNLGGTILPADPSACPRADNSGNALVLATVPTDATAAPALNVLAGRDCLGTTPPIVTDPFPRVVDLGQLTVTADAPTITVPAKVEPAAGATLRLTGEGFPASTSVQVRRDDAVWATVASDAQGRIDASLAASVVWPNGTYSVVATGGGAGAAATFEVVRPEAAITGDGHVQGGQLQVSLRNFLRQDGLGGQSVAFRIDAAGPVLACIATNSGGDADGVVPIPADLAVGPHTLNVLAGTACGTGSELPARSLTAAFAVAAAPAPEPQATITSATHVPGGALNVSLTGFLRQDGLGGQKVAFKIDFAGDVLACIQTDANGAGSGTVPIPATTPLGARTLNVLAGSACGEGAQMPARSLTAPFAVTAAPAVPDPGTQDPGTQDPGIQAPAAQEPAPGPGTPAPAPAPEPAPTLTRAATINGAAVLNNATRLRLNLRGGTAARTVITVRSAARVRLRPGARPQVVQVARAATTRRAGAVTLAITPQGRVVLRRAGQLRVVVHSAPRGGRATARTLVLRVPAAARTPVNRAR